MASSAPVADTMPQVLLADSALHFAARRFYEDVAVQANGQASPRRLASINPASPPLRPPPFPTKLQLLYDQAGRSLAPAGATARRAVAQKPFIRMCLLDDLHY